MNRTILTILAVTLLAASFAPTQAEPLLGECWAREIKTFTVTDRQVADEPRKVVYRSGCDDNIHDLDNPRGTEEHGAKESFDAAAAAHDATYGLAPGKEVNDYCQALGQRTYCRVITTYTLSA